MSNYNVVEIFSSINGEGPRSGQLALFIRMQGCNLDCGYCDTRWANEEDCRSHWTSTEEILDFVRQMQIKNVTITGGEPLLYPGFDELYTWLGKSGIRSALKSIARREEMECRVYPHKLRKTLGMNLKNRGADIGVIQEIMGHANPTVTSRYYAQSTPETLRGVRQRTAA